MAENTNVVSFLFIKDYKLRVRLTILKVKMENNRGTENRESRPVIGSGRKGLAMIQTQKKSSSEGVCHDDIASPLRAQTIDQLHSLQKKKSAPNTPSTGAQGAFASAFATISEEDRQKQQLQSIR